MNLLCNNLPYTVVVLIVIQEGRAVSHVISVNNQLIHSVNACDMMGLC